MEFQKKSTTIMDHHTIAPVGENMPRTQGLKLNPILLSIHKAMMSSIVKVTHAALAEGKDPKTEVIKFLRNYRNTPHSSTGKKPSELMMDRDMRTKVPMIIRAATRRARRGRTPREARPGNTRATAGSKRFRIMPVPYRKPPPLSRRDTLRNRVT